jgi:hypothetical protein
MKKGGTLRLPGERGKCSLQAEHPHPSPNQEPHYLTMNYIETLRRYVVAAVRK